MLYGLPSVSVVKDLLLNGGDIGFSPWVRKVPWGGKWQPISVFWAGEFHGQRNLVGYRPQRHTESDATETKHARNCSAVLC